MPHNQGHISVAPEEIRTYGSNVAAAASDIADAASRSGLTDAAGLVRGSKTAVALVGLDALVQAAIMHASQQLNQLSPTVTRAADTYVAADTEASKGFPEGELRV